MLEARFVERRNRFLLLARRPDGALLEAHLPDPGRLTELLVPGRRVWLRPAPAGSVAGTAAGRLRGAGGRRRRARRTSWTAALVEAPGGGGLVSVDTALPNRLVAEAIRAGAMEELRGWRLGRAEVRVGHSRFDFLLRADGGRSLLLEVKSVTLVQGGVGLFPDAVTDRGARHVRELEEVVRSGAASAAVLFVLQRRDAGRVRAAAEIDAAFAAALRSAREAGVRALARRCHVRLGRVTLGEAVPVE